MIPVTIKLLGRALRKQLLVTIKLENLDLAEYLLTRVPQNLQLPLKEFRLDIKRGI